MCGRDDAKLLDTRPAGAPQARRRRDLRGDIQAPWAPANGNLSTHAVKHLLSAAGQAVSHKVRSTPSNGDIQGAQPLGKVPPQATASHGSVVDRKRNKSGPSRSTECSCGAWHVKG